MTERREIENAIAKYAIQHEITESEALGFLARRSEIEIMFDLLGLSATERMTRTVSYQEKEMVISVFAGRGFRLRGLKSFEKSRRFWSTYVLFCRSRLKNRD